MRNDLLSALLFGLVNTPRRGTRRHGSPRELALAVAAHWHVQRLKIDNPILHRARKFSVS